MLPRRTNLTSASLLLLTMLMVLAPVCAPASTSDEVKTGQVKVAVLYNILKFVTFSASSPVCSSPQLNIVVLGEGVFAEAVLALQDKKAGEKTIRIRRLSFVDPIPPETDVLVIGGTRPIPPRVFNTATARCLLTVSDQVGFVERGGIFGLYLSNNRISFDINLDTAKGCGMTISSKLAALAHMILEDGKKRTFH